MGDVEVLDLLLASVGIVNGKLGEREVRSWAELVGGMLSFLMTGIPD